MVYQKVDLGISPDASFPVQFAPMLVSFDHDFLFVHIPKTGGTSVRKALAPFAAEPLNHWQNRGLKLLGINTNVKLGSFQSYSYRKHAEISTAQRCIPRDVFARLFKFSFVRNPWDLLVSNYWYILDHPSHKRYRRVSKMTFPEFVEFAAAKGTGFQKKVISDASGNLLVDQVGFFERLKSDFEKMTDQLSIAAELPHLNQVQRADYREFYNTKTRNRVAELYREDIEAFEYEFHSRRVDSTILVQRSA